MDDDDDTLILTPEDKERLMKELPKDVREDDDEDD